MSDNTPDPPTEIPTGLPVRLPRSPLTELARSRPPGAVADIGGMSAASAHPRLPERPARDAPTARTPVVHLVDDDDAVLRSLVFLLHSVEIDALTYPDGATFLAELDREEPGVVILDVRMPGVSGLQIQKTLTEWSYPGPIIFCSAHGDIPTAVRTIRSGAVDFLEKPYDPQRLLEVVQLQLAAAAIAFAKRTETEYVRARVAPLTSRERDVLRLILDGLPNRAIARRLEVSPKTVEVHRARIKTKTGTDSIASLVHDLLVHDIRV